MCIIFITKLAHVSSFYLLEESPWCKSFIKWITSILDLFILLLSSWIPELRSFSPLNRRSNYEKMAHFLATPRKLTV